ncbi:MAG: hypothetical protein ACXAC2_26015, partial [Candidatus Kariarchaeaceae archaeon]|jgi:hypothetical protein
VMEDSILQSVILDSRSQQLISVSYDYDTTDSVFEIVNYITLEQTNFRFTSSEIRNTLKLGVTISQLNAGPILLPLGVFSLIMAIRRKTA